MDEVERFAELPEVAIRMDEALELLDSSSDGEAGMTLSELNGFLCGVAVCPEAIGEDEWLPEIWDAASSADSGPFGSKEQETAFREAVMAYYKSVLDELGSGEFQPIYDIDGDPETEQDVTGEIIWELWILGFARAYDLRPEAWDRLIDSGDEETADAMMHMVGLIAIVAPEEEPDEPLTDDDLAEIQEAAPDLIAFAVSALYHARHQLH